LEYVSSLSSTATSAKAFTPSTGEGARAICGYTDGVVTCRHPVFRGSTGAYVVVPRLNMGKNFRFSVRQQVSFVGGSVHVPNSCSASVRSRLCDDSEIVAASIRQQVAGPGTLAASTSSRIRRPGAYRNTFGGARRCTRSVYVNPPIRPFHQRTCPFA